MEWASASHCWYAPDNPDAQAKTLETVAAGLAELLPKLERWGVAEMGIFFDWASLYQNKPVPRTPPQQVRVTTSLLAASGSICSLTLAWLVRS